MGGSASTAGTSEFYIFRQFYLPDYTAITQTQEWGGSEVGSATADIVAIEEALHRVVEAAGLNPAEVVRHTLRHTAITHLVQAGVDLPTVQRVSGHKTLDMVVRYSHQNGEHIQVAMDRLAERYNSSIGK